MSVLFFAEKIWNIFKDRRRLIVTYNFKGLPSLGNDIFILNSGKNSIMITHYELFWAKGWLFKKIYKVERMFAEDNPMYITIQPQSAFKINFSDEDYFEWGVKMSRYGKLYIKLDILGAWRPKIYKVYDPLK